MWGYTDCTEYALCDTTYRKKAQKKNSSIRSVKTVPRILAKSAEGIVFVFIPFTYLFVCHMSAEFYHQTFTSDT